MEMSNGILQNSTRKQRFLDWGSKGLWILSLLALGLTQNPFGLAQTPETPLQVIDRAHQAHGGLWRSGDIVDWVAQGQITIMGDPRGPFNMTLMVKGRDKVQRIVAQPGTELRYGADGTRSWQRSGPFTKGPYGRVTYFLDSKTIRSVRRFFNPLIERLILRDLGTRIQELGPNPGPSRVIEAEDGSGRRTRYYIDNATSHVTRLEFETGTIQRQLFSGRPIPVMSTLVFSDYRTVAGVRTAFRVDVYLGTIRIEQIGLTSVRYNAGLSDSVFRP